MKYLLKEYKQYLNIIINHYPVKYSNEFVCQHIHTYHHLKDFFSIMHQQDVEIINVNADFIEMFKDYLAQFDKFVDTLNALKCLKSVCYIQMHTCTKYLTHPLLSTFATDVSINLSTNQKSLKTTQSQLELFKFYSLPL